MNKGQWLAYGISLILIASAYFILGVDAYLKAQWGFWARFVGAGLFVGAAPLWIGDVVYKFYQRRFRER